MGSGIPNFNFADQLLRPRLIGGFCQVSEGTNPDENMVGFKAIFKRMETTR
jgi:hypothetical protein